MDENFNFKDLKLIADKKNQVIFFDLGANLGEITKRVENFKVKKNIKIFSFEPDIENFKTLENKFKENKNITLENKAVWNYNGKINFSIGRCNHRTNSKITKIINDRNYDEKKYINTCEVDCVDLCDYIDNLNLSEDDFVAIKMDIEGAEYEVLNHMIEKNGIKNIDLLLIEFHREPEPGISKKLLLKKITENSSKIKIYEEYSAGYYRRCEI